MQFKQIQGKEKATQRSTSAQLQMKFVMVAQAEMPKAKRNTWHMNKVIALRQAVRIEMALQIYKPVTHNLPAVSISLLSLHTHLMLLFLFSVCILGGLTVSASCAESHISV